MVMMQVWEMRMFVPQFCVPVLVHMGFSQWLIGSMFVKMMLVVHVFMFMFHLFMLVFMRMLLSQVQPQSNTH